MASPAPTTVGTATWTNGGNTVTLASPVTATIDDCEVAWTGAANVTATASVSYYRAGAASASLVIATAFTTGLVAYKTLTTTDLSGYQQISLMVLSSAAKADGVFQLCLCSDTVGAVPVNTITLPALSSACWIPVTVDTGGALGNAIQSIALYAVSDPASMTLRLDNILACKAPSAADSLTHQSLISKNTDENEPWFTINSILGTTVTLGCGDNSSATPGSNACRYYGPSATTTLYKREPLQIAAGVPVRYAYGSQASPIIVSGGWGTADMTTQSDRTWVRTPPATSTFACADDTQSGLVLSKFGAVAPHAYGYYLGQTVFTDDCVCAGTEVAFYYVAVSTYQITRIRNARYVVGCYQAVYYAASVYGHSQQHQAELGKVWGFGGGGSYLVYFANTRRLDARLKITEAQNLSSVFYDGTTAAVGDLHIEGATFANCTNIANMRTSVRIFAKDCVGMGAAPSWGPTFFHTRYDKTEGDHRVWLPDGSIISSEAAVRHTPDGLAWKLAVNTASGFKAYCGPEWPTALPVAKVAVAAGVMTTVAVWVRLQTADITLRLRVAGGQLAGVASDVIATTTDLDVWRQLSVSFTPTESGVIEATVEAWNTVAGTPGIAYVDDVSVS